MSYPIINNNELYQGLVFYQDSEDPGNWFVPPTKNPWKITDPVSIGTRVLISARKDYMPDNDLINKFSSSKDGARVTPLSLTNFVNNTALNLSWNNSHEIKLDVINNLPYPELLFSATLLTTAPDYNDVLSRIKDGLKNENILKGELNMSFQAVEVINKIMLSYNLRTILTNLKQGAVDHPVKCSFYQLLNSYIENNFSEMVKTDYSPLSKEAISIVKGYLFDTLLAVFVSFSDKKTYFNGSMSCDSVVIRDSAELQQKDTTSSYVQTNLVTKTMAL